MNSFQAAEHSSPWDRHVARILSSHESSCDSAGELADPNEIEYFLSNDLDFLYNEELRSASRSAFDLIKEQRKRDLSSLFFFPSEESCSSSTNSFHGSRDTSSLRSYHSTDAFESLGHHGEDFETTITKRARIEPTLDEGSIYRDSTSLKEKNKDLHAPDVLFFAHDSSSPFESVEELHSFVEEYQKGLDALTQCIKRTTETRSKVAMIKDVYMKQPSTEKFAITSKIFRDQLNLEANRTSNNRELKYKDVKADELIGKDIHLSRNSFDQRTNSVSSLETEDSTESK